jgi:hypothetical protein
MMAVGADHSPRVETLAPGRSHMSKQESRKAFVAPRIEEQASLVGVTLISGGHTTFRSKGRCKTKTKTNSSYHRHS